jgi:hypothetical protein
MKWLMLALLLCGVTGITACSLNRASLVANDWDWKPRGSNVFPDTDAEKLAVEVTQGAGKSLARGNLRAYSEGEERGFLVVAVEETPADTEEPIIKIRYRILGQQILFESYPQYVMQVDKKREANAREVAYQAKEGRLPVLPAIYDGNYLYEPSYDGGCQVEVTEKDIEREPVATYIINVCE